MPKKAKKRQNKSWLLGVDFGLNSSDDKSAMVIASYNEGQIYDNFVIISF